LKVVYLFLLLVTSESSYYWKKIEVKTFLTCDEIFEALVEFKEVKNGYLGFYNNYTVGSHYCINAHGKWYLGTEYE
jgi:hypothetical protein|tara:strand:+ start:2747 stop:2974 length:228 start_codon:yes stop_codon:yes gene_type:complete